MLQKMREGVGRWVAAIILGLLAVAFIFWGVDPTIMGTTFAAKVNGEDVSLLNFERALQVQQNQYQELYRLELSDDLRRELRLSVLERLVRNEALSQRVTSQGYRISDERLTGAIRARSEFQIAGEFSMDSYRSQLLYQGMSPTLYEELEREQLALTELQNGIAMSAFYTASELERYIELFNQQREVAYALFEATAFRDQVVLEETDIVAYYENNKERFYTEENVDLEYVEVLRADLAEGIEVTDEILEAYYEDERYRFQTDEERRASHILINAQEDDPEAEARAADILAQLEAGGDFETLANDLSEDVGTSGQGGDLGWVSQGMLVGPFEDTLFAMELGEVQGPVKTAFGYHLIRLDELREGDLRTFESVKDELVGDYQSSRAEQLFYDRATALADASFDAFDELASVAAEMELPLRSFEGFTRTGSVTPFTVSAPVVQTAFSPEILEQGENSGLVEILDDHVLVLRVTAHHPPAEQPLDMVRPDIEEELSRTAAEALAEAAASAFLAASTELPVERVPVVPALTAVEASAAAVAAEESAAVEDQTPGSEGADSEDQAPETLTPHAALALEQGGAWTVATWVERTNPAVPTEILAAAYRLSQGPDGEAIREGVPLASGDQAVVVLSGVKPGTVDTSTREETQQQLSQLAEQTAMFELTSYAGEVRDQATVRIPDVVIDPPLY